MPTIQLRAERPPTNGPSQEWATMYATSVVGIMRIAGIVSTLIAFLCSFSPEAWYSGDGWVHFATTSAFIEGVIWFVLHILNVIPRAVANQYIELTVFALSTVFLFIASIIVAVGAGYWRPYYNYEFESRAYEASAFFCFVSTFLWGADTVLQFLQVRATSSSPAGGTTGQQPPPYNVESGLAFSYG